jgi:hypothetical protein
MLRKLLKEVVAACGTFRHILQSAEDLPAEITVFGVARPAMAA